MTQTWETKLTPEQEAAKVVRIVLYESHLVDHFAQLAFYKTFHSLGLVKNMMVEDAIHEPYRGARLFLGEIALELAFDGRNAQGTYFNRVLYPISDTIIGGIILMNATARMDDQIYYGQFQRAKLKIQVLKNLYGIRFPLTIAALKMDHEELFTVEELRILLNSPRYTELTDIPILLCDPINRESVKEVLLTALEAGLRYVDFDADEVANG